MVDLVLQETGLEPGHLELEITETVIMSDVDATIASLQSINCHEMQGDVVSPPVPAEEFYNFVSAWRAEKKYLQIIKGS